MTRASTGRATSASPLRGPRSEQHPHGFADERRQRRRFGARQFLEGAPHRAGQTHSSGPDSFLWRGPRAGVGPTTRTDFGYLRLTHAPNMGRYFEKRKLSGGFVSRFRPVLEKPLETERNRGSDGPCCSPRHDHRGLPERQKKGDPRREAEGAVEELGRETGEPGTEPPERPAARKEEREGSGREADEKDLRHIPLRRSRQHLRGRGRGRRSFPTGFASSPQHVGASSDRIGRAQRGQRHTAIVTASGRSTSAPRCPRPACPRS